MDKTGFWFEVELERLEAGLIRIKGRSSRGEESGALTVPAKPLHDFGDALMRAAEQQSPLDSRRTEAQALYEAVFQGEVRTCWDRLRGAAGEQPVLLNWRVN